MRIQEGHFLKIALNPVLTLSDDGECPAFFDSPRNYWFRCILRRVMVIFRQQKNFGPNVRYCVLDIMKNNCSYIVSFVVKSPSGGKNPWKTAPANPRRSLFENCFKSWFDTVRWWGMSWTFDFFRNYWFRCFLRRVMAILRQQKNFGPNVRYCVFGYQEKHFTKHKLWFMFVNCSYIVSFVVKSPSGGKHPWKTTPANPRRSLFENCFKSWVDNVRWWGTSYFFWFAPELLI